jgi:hypothetical protein
VSFEPRNRRYARPDRSRLDSTTQPDGPLSASINVDLPHDRYRALALTLGETVFIKVRDARVFVAEDYQISRSEHRTTGLDRNCAASSEPCLNRPRLPGEVDSR